MQPLPASVGQIDLSARYRYLVVQEDIRHEIRRKLVNVAQSTPKDERFFILKDQATKANKILSLVEVRTIDGFLFSVYSGYDTAFLMSGG